MKTAYTAPKVFAYGDVSDIVQYRIFQYKFWDFVTRRRYWLPWGPV